MVDIAPLEETKYPEYIGQMEDHLDVSNASEENDGLSIFKLLGVDLCARAILDYVPIKDLVRSERVCKQWQAVVQKYLKGSRTLSFYDVVSLQYSMYDETIQFPIDIDRKIVMSPQHSTLQACKTIKKWGPSIIKVTTDCRNKEYSNTIASHCFNLQHIEMPIYRSIHSQLYLINKLNKLKQISFHFCRQTSNVDDILRQLFKNIDCEKIEITSHYVNDVTGKFLRFLKTRDLKFLRLGFCRKLSFPDLLCATHSIRNITSLALDHNDINTFLNIHLMLKEMPQLEELSLQGYFQFSPRNICEELVETFSRLHNLKRLNMKNNDSVNDAVLKALARGCKKLEYLDISECNLHCNGKGLITAQGVEALCRRSPTAVTTLHLGYITCETDVTLDDKLFNDFLNSPLIRELKALCCVELNAQWFKAAAALWSSRGGRVPLQLKSDCIPVDAQGSREKLKIILFDLCEYLEIYLVPFGRVRNRLR